MSVSQDLDLDISTIEISKCHIKLSLEMPEKITFFSDLKVQSYAFYF